MKSLLSFPSVYEWFQRLLGAKRSRERLCTEHLKIKKGERVLDIGCGPATILQTLNEDIHYVGIDLSQSYIDQARARFGNRATFLCCPVDEVNPEKLGGYFDIVMAIGLIHHLNDDEARTLFRLAAAKLKPTGRFCSFDGCFTSKQHPFARWMLRNDRGKYVREQAAYESLAATAFADVQATVAHDFLRIPYTHIILECRNPVEHADKVAPADPAKLS